MTEVYIVTKSEDQCDTQQTGTRALANRGRVCHTKSINRKRPMSFFVCQLQPHNNEVEVIYTCTSEQQAINACDMQNAHLADAGIPGEYYFFVL